MERIEKLNELTGNLMQVEKLKRDVAILHLSVISQEKALADAQEKLEAAKSLLNSTLDRIDAAFLLLYQSAQPVQVEDPKKTRGKKTGAAAPDAPAEQVEKHPCPHCEDVYYSAGSLTLHLHSAHKVALQERPTEKAALPLCATCIAPCNKFEDHSFEQAYHCGGFTTEPNEDQVKWRDITCEEWRTCIFQNKCFGPANEYDPTCFKEDEIRRRGEASLAAESKASAPPLPDPEARRAQLVKEKARRDSLCGEWLGCDLHRECFKQAHEGHACMKSAPSEASALCKACQEQSGCDQCCKTCETKCSNEMFCCVDASACDKCGGEGMYIEDDIEDGGGEIYCSCPAGVALKEKDEAAVPADESDADVLSRHEPAEAILPRGEFRSEDLPKGKKKQTALLEERRKAVADLVARRIELFKRGSAAVSDYDKSMGYGLDYNLTQNKIQLSYALSQFNGLDRLLNPTSEQETNHEAVTQEAGPEGVEEKQEGAAADVPGGAAQQFLPLDEPLGDCELCMGYGVIEGELYGASTLVPCSCEAGLKVKGGDVTPECCKKCNIADPDCANCPLPDMQGTERAECGYTDCLAFSATADDHCGMPPEAREHNGFALVSDCQFFKASEASAANAEPAELAKCANGSCTATGKDAKDVCLRIGVLGRAAQECKNFVPVDKCSHHMLKRSTAPDGSTVCDLCGFVLRPAPQYEPEKPALTPMQQKCTHPKVFREETETGTICKVCKLNLTQPALFS